LIKNSTRHNGSVGGHKKVICCQTFQLLWCRILTRDEPFDHSNTMYFDYLRNLII